VRSLVVPHPNSMDDQFRGKGGGVRGHGKKRTEPVPTGGKKIDGAKSWVHVGTRFSWAEPNVKAKTPRASDQEARSVFGENDGGWQGGSLFKPKILKGPFQVFRGGRSGGRTKKSS